MSNPFHVSLKKLKDEEKERKDFLEKRDAETKRKTELDQKRIQQMDEILKNLSGFYDPELIWERQERLDANGQRSWVWHLAGREEPPACCFKDCSTNVVSLEKPFSIPLADTAWVTMDSCHNAKPQTLVFSVIEHKRHSPDGNRADFTNLWLGSIPEKPLRLFSSRQEKQIVNIITKRLAFHGITPADDMTEEFSYSQPTRLTQSILRAVERVRAAYRNYRNG